MKSSDGNGASLTFHVHQTYWRIRSSACAILAAEPVPLAAEEGLRRCENSGYGLQRS